MIIYKSGNIFLSSALSLVNPVNTMGVMGKGLALQFKNKFPDAYRKYKAGCTFGLVKVGFVFSTWDGLNKVWVIHFPTKQHWKHSSKLEWIELGLIDLKKNLENIKKDNNFPITALPPLGCGLGGLHWCDVKNKIEEVFMNEDYYIEVFEPF